MSFDRDARNALQRTVSSLRDVLREDVTDQLRRLGIQESGQVLDLDAIAGLTEDDRHTGEAMRVLLEHYVAGEQRGTESERHRAAHDRMAREIGFSNLNRLIAIRMAEERGILAAPAVGNGLDSDGFKVYEIVANGTLGSRYDTYRAFIDALLDEVAIDLPALFDRGDVRTRMFPGEHALAQVFSAINAPDIARLWREDEAIGWVYQYYNDPDERQEMRSHGAPRNSRELAVRNQFFTPRYVVEFLTDNTLGRTWYEMRKGETTLTDTSRYLVRRKHQIWLDKGEQEPQPFMPSQDGTWPSMSDDPDKIWTRPNPDLNGEQAIWEYALTFNGYGYSDRFHDFESVAGFANQKAEEFEQTGSWNGTFEELRICLFFEQRRNRHLDDEMSDSQLENLIALNQAICERWEIEVEAIPYRQKKDPQRLRIMDPACGSCHFLLYAFDVLQIIYEEAYDDPDLGPPLQRAYPDRAQYSCNIPRLILENNLHGIDIDARAVQIGSFALWLRAQRHWHELGVSAIDRPHVQKTNIVTAEPMPGEREMLEEYLKTVDPRLWDLVHEVWNRMELAGEAGSLLKIEEDIRDAVRTASRESLVPDQVAQMTYYEGDQAPRQQAIQLATKDDIAFWGQAEERLLKALKDYAEHATNGQRIHRRLFAEDAVQGFAFLDLCRARYDVVLMNPPFGTGPEAIDPLITYAYTGVANELACAFVERGLSWTTDQGLVGSLTTRTIFLQPNSEKWRVDVMRKGKRIKIVADLGYEVLDAATVEVAAYVSHRKPTNASLWMRFNAVNDKANSLQQSVHQLAAIGESELVFPVAPSLFGSLPKNAFSYWIPKPILQMLNESEPFENESRSARCGMGTLDDFRFLRAWWEVDLRERRVAGEIEPITLRRWIPYAKGGTASPFYSPIPLVVNYDMDGREVKAFVKAKVGSASRKIQAQAFYFRPGLTFGRRIRRFSPSILPSGTIFSDSSNAVFFNDDDETAIWTYLALLNGSLLRYLISLFAPERKIEVGYLQRMPVPTLHSDTTRLSELGQSGYVEMRTLLETDETDRLFIGPDGLYPLLSDGLTTTRERLIAILDELDEQAVTMFGLSDAFSSLDNTNGASDIPLQDSSALVQQFMRDGSDRARDIVSWMIGILFGRWNIQVGVSTPNRGKAVPTVTSLPTSPPGMLNRSLNRGTALDESADARVEALSSVIGSNPASGHRDPFDYTGSSPRDCALPEPLLVVDSESPIDIFRRWDELLSAIWQMDAIDVERELAAALGVRDIKVYFEKPSGFFADHLSKYSIGGRKAPIYWPLSTASGSYTIWLYYPRVTSDTIFTIVNKDLNPKIISVERSLSEMRQALVSASGGAATRLQRDVESEQELRRELIDMRDEMLRIAALPYQPNLDDGVIINAAPFHRLFRHRAWAKATEDTWKKLEKGEYDWAHLAYAIWPDRVRDVCRTDKSIAIAHGLEDLYVEAPPTAKKGKGRARQRAIAEDDA